MGINNWCNKAIKSYFWMPFWKRVRTRNTYCVCNTKTCSNLVLAGWSWQAVTQFNFWILELIFRYSVLFRWKFLLQQWFAAGSLYDYGAPIAYRPRRMIFNCEIKIIFIITYMHCRKGYGNIHKFVLFERTFKMIINFLYNYSVSCLVFEINRLILIKSR
jgi:hypothetical protein